MSAGKVLHVVRPIISSNKEEARARAIKLYKVWYRSIPWIAHKFKWYVPVPPARMYKKLRDEFDKNKHHTDLRVIDMIIFRSQLDLREIDELWAQPCHLMGAYFRDTVNKTPPDFLSKFFASPD